MLSKKRRQRILLSTVCVVVAVLIFCVTLAKTSDRWKLGRKSKGGDREVVFYATSNTPYDAREQQQLVNDLFHMPYDGDFIAHVGNVQDSSESLCSANRYGEVASLLKMSQVPVFIVPGEEDWIKCPNQDYSFAKWMEAFGSFETNFQAKHAAVHEEFQRPKSTPEIFSALHQGVLVFGLHLVSGATPDDSKQLFLKEEKMKVFVRGTISSLRGRFRAIALLGNARPGPQQMPFFDGIASDLRSANVPTAYIYANTGGRSDGYKRHYPFSGSSENGLDNVLGIQVPAGGKHDYVRITVGFDGSFRME